jgi:hypothetical protein
MTSTLKELLERITRYLDHLRGARTSKVIAVNSHPDETYHALADGKKISFYCTETIYEIRFKKWWVPTERHYTYKVYGICDPAISPEFVESVGKDFYIGRLLPWTASRSDQKKAAIHAYVNLIAGKLNQQRSENA